MYYDGECGTGIYILCTVNTNNLTSNQLYKTRRIARSPDVRRFVARRILTVRTDQNYSPSTPTTTYLTTLLAFYSKNDQFNFYYEDTFNL